MNLFGAADGAAGMLFFPNAISAIVLVSVVSWGRGVI